MFILYNVFDLVFRVVVAVQSVQMISWPLPTGIEQPVA